VTGGAELFRAFDDPKLASSLAGRLARLEIPRPLTLMHVCGTHEHAIARAGIRSLLPPGVRLIAGPGCPVCVCPAVDIDLAIQAALRDDMTVTTFGDMFRVPSGETSLEQLRAQERDVRVVYSPLDAVRIAREEPGAQVVFVAVGFETTAGPIAAALLGDVPDNFTVIPSLRLIPPALAFLLEGAGTQVDGFVLPGHVSTVLGRAGYDVLERDGGVPAVIAGFEAVDILQAVFELIEEALSGPPHAVRNLYRRVVSENGNVRARETIARAFEPVDSIWRGIGVIPRSGLALRPALRKLDAVLRFGLERRDGIADARPGCICHEVILGLSEPEACPLFGGACTPRRPYGPCMVSSEGTCRARYQYRGTPRG
jgi:hydrogenase expression/formation protein HypD